MQFANIAPNPSATARPTIVEKLLGLAPFAKLSNRVWTSPHTFRRGVAGGLYIKPGYTIKTIKDPLPNNHVL